MTTKSTNFILFAFLIAVLGFGFNLISSGLQIITFCIFVAAAVTGLYGIRLDR